MEMDVMDFEKDSSEGPSSSVKTIQLCMTCDDDTEAAGFCVDCVEYLCVSCVKAHQRVKFTRHHRVIEMSKEARGVFTQKPLFCDIHKQQSLKLFCQTCDLLTCRDCQLIEHKEHNYEFLEDAYKSLKQHLESLTNQLQERKKLVKKVSNAISDGLLLVEKNRASVRDEIEKSVCSLVLEINRKGKMLVDQLEAVAKGHKRGLQKQQEDICNLSRHLDHVINFTRWATAMSEGTALLYCKRSVLFQIENLLQATCSSTFVPPDVVEFQSRASYWASNVDLGSLVVENVSGHQSGCFVDFSSWHTNPHHDPSGSPHSSLAQLQMQVDKLNPLNCCQHQPAPTWSCYQSVPLPRTVPGPPQGVSVSSRTPLQPGCRSKVLPSSKISSTCSLLNPGSSPQTEPTDVNRRNYSAD